MARKANTDSENSYENAFARRIRDLLGGNNRFGKTITQEEIASVMGVTRQAVGQYYNGATYPTIDKLEKLADYFEVSTDYILGRTDIKSPDIDIQSICEKTGLSDESLKVLEYVKDEYYKVDESQFVYEDSYLAFCEALNDFIGKDGFVNLIMQYKKYLLNKMFFSDYSTFAGDKIVPCEGGYLPDPVILSKYKCEEQFRIILNRKRDQNKTTNDRENLKLYLEKINERINCGNDTVNSDFKEGDPDGGDKKEE